MRKFILLAFALIVGVSAFVSCGKSGDTTATITVLDAGGLPVPGALVNVVGYDSYGYNSGRIDRETQTDGNGKAVFNFNDLYQRGAAGFAVLEITATKAGLTGDGIIKVEEEKNNEATVSIQ
ncbi:MAG: hypothetical protein K1X56_14500 [Flavobacteriales bacterium]|nr:hypothetical protein [Flavobacteriales bacterium]